MDYKEIIKKGYDELNKTYQDNYSENSNVYKALDLFQKYIAPNSKIVDFGCGTGIPAGRYLIAKGYEVTGVDISPEMIKLSKINVPAMHSICSDFSKLPMVDNSFDAGIALFSLLHVAKKDMLAVLKEFHRVIKQGGYLIFCVNKGDFEGYSALLGKKMFFACFQENELKEYLRIAKFSIILKYVDTFEINGEVENQMFYLVKLI